MFDFIKEHNDLWQYLKTATKPITLYGMGNGAEKIMAVLDSYNIKLSAIFASDEFVRGHSFKGYPVLKYSESVQKYGSFIVLVSFGTERADVIAKIMQINAEQELYAPDVPVIGDGLWTYDYYLEHSNEIENAYNLLADQSSKSVFTDIIDFKLSGKVHYLASSASPQNQVYEDLIHLGSNEIYLDLGAYTGDTVAEFVHLTQNKYEKIIAMEPDYKNFNKLVKRVADKHYQNVECLNLGAWYEKDIKFFSSMAGRNSTLSGNKGKEIMVDSIDDILQAAPATYIKMDVEGAEKNALMGAKNTLALFKPKLLVSAYHRNEDIFELPLLINQLNADYKIYLRRHPSIPAWNINIYAI